jgi:hypothetical protein
MNQVEFAAYMGVSKQYISSLIKRGALTGAYTVDNQGYDIDAAKAKAIIIANMDPSRTRGRKPPGRPPGPKKPDKPKKKPQPKPKAVKPKKKSAKPKKPKIAGTPAPEPKPQPTPEEKEHVIESAGIVREMDFGRARTLHEQYKAALKKLEFDRQKGLVIDGPETYRRRFEIARQIRDQCLSIADRCAPVVAAESDQHKCREILLTEIRYIIDGIRQEISGL